MGYSPNAVYKYIIFKLYLNCDASFVEFQIIDNKKLSEVKHHDYPGHK